MKKFLVIIALAASLFLNVMLLAVIFQDQPVEVRDQKLVQRDQKVFQPAKPKEADPEKVKPREESEFSKEWNELQNPELGFYYDPYRWYVEREGDLLTSSDIEAREQRRSVAEMLRNSNPVESHLLGYFLLTKEHYADVRKKAVEQAEDHLRQCRDGRLIKAHRIRHLMEGFNLNDQEIGAKEGEVKAFIHQQEVLTAKFYLQKHREGNHHAWRYISDRQDLLKEIGVSKEEYEKLNHQFLLTQAKRNLAKCRKTPCLLSLYEREIRSVPLGEIGTSEEELADLRKKGER